MARFYSLHFRRFFNLSSADQCSAEQFNHLSTVDCHDWIYDQSVYTSTFAAEVNMVCGKSWQGPMFQSVYFAGILVRFYLSLG